MRVSKSVRQHVAAIGLAVFGLTSIGVTGALTSSAAQAQGYGDYEAWEYCARENKVCEVHGPTQIRFGVDGAFSYRRVAGSVRCDVQTFGDPAPGQRKSCYVQADAVQQGYGYGQPQAFGNDDEGFVDCARENRYCEARGPATIRYGASGRYFYLNVHNESVLCNNEIFGDPSPGERKRCEIRVESNYGYGNNRPYSAPPINSGPGYAGSWVECARENDRCRLPGPAIVRYGASGAFVTRQVSGGEVNCDNRTFGDPAPRARKYCEYQLLPYSAGGSGGWRVCAREQEFCSFNGRRTVRYGAGNGRQVVREMRNGTYCNNQAFGADPAPGKKKVCEVQDY
jgi:hypothetical protein